MVKDAAQLEEVRLPATSLKDPVSRRMPSFPKPEQRQQPTEA